jgi:hypothetical protein
MFPAAMREGPRGLTGAFPFLDTRTEEAASYSGRENPENRMKLSAAAARPQAAHGR